MSSGCLAGDYTWYITQPRRERTNIHHPRQLGPLLLSPDDDDVDGDDDDDDDDDDVRLTCQFSLSVLGQHLCTVVFENRSFISKQKEILI